MKNGIEGHIQTLESITHPQDKKQAALTFWNEMVANSMVPYTRDSSAVFLYFGDAESVAWNGDFNGWGDNKALNFTGTRIPGTDLWYLKKTFPSDARFDYKITLNGEEWILDPANPHQQVSGFGPNSELRMPQWKDEPLSRPISDAPKGIFGEETIIESNYLNYLVSYRVYIPAGYDNLHDLNVIYVTDGQEYADQAMGAMVTVLDNLHYLDKIEPTIAVFVSPLSPGDESENRRADEFGNNPAYLDFFVHELLPKVETEFRISREKEHRAILGTSLGGLNATYFGFSRPDLFQHVGIQAPAFWYREEIYDLVKASDLNNSNIFLSVGTVGDNTLDARLMKSIFEDKGIETEYLEVNQGHSWGAWRTQIDDILIHFFGK